MIHTPEGLQEKTTERTQTKKKKNHIRPHRHGLINTDGLAAAKDIVLLSVPGQSQNH